MKNKKMLAVVLIILIFLFAVFFIWKLSIEKLELSKNKSEIQNTQTILIDEPMEDFSYSIEKYDNKEEFMNVKLVANCINFEANFESGACSKYEYKYTKNDREIKIVLTNLENCSWHMKNYGVKGRVCNLEKGTYDVILGVESGGNKIMEQFRKSIAIK